jgi:hypothetical protein
MPSARRFKEGVQKARVRGMEAGPLWLQAVEIALLLELRWGRFFLQKKRPDGRLFYYNEALDPY